MTWGSDIKLSAGYKLNDTTTFDFFVDIFNLFNTQDEQDSDERYTNDNMNPIVAGDTSDLRHAKAISDVKLQTNQTPTLIKNFGNTNARQAPRSMRLGMRVTF